MRLLALVLAIVLAVQTNGFGGWATLTGKYNAGLPLNID